MTTPNNDRVATFNDLFPEGDVPYRGSLKKMDDIRDMDVQLYDMTLETYTVASQYNKIGDKYIACKGYVIGKKEEEFTMMISQQTPFRMLSHALMIQNHLACRFIKDGRAWTIAPVRNQELATLEWSGQNVPF